MCGFVGVRVVLGWWLLWALLVKLGLGVLIAMFLVVMFGSLAIAGFNCGVCGCFVFDCVRVGLLDCLFFVCLMLWLLSDWFAFG